MRMGTTRVSTSPGLVRESWSTMAGSRCSATSNAAPRSRLILRLIDLAISEASTTAMIREPRTTAAFTIMSRRAVAAMSCASSSAASTSSRSMVRYASNSEVAAVNQLCSVTPFAASASASPPAPMCETISASAGASGALLATLSAASAITSESRWVSSSVPAEAYSAWAMRSR
ncbi:hypothetical protein STBA_16930 [Streptomyces sp. MP131-18]|nr:hypothetical protein STBA_16930 [Streptomyces sp. MP131-18]